MARTSHVILGADLESPADLVAYWTKGGKWVGGTAQGLHLARREGIAIVGVKE